MKSERIHEGMTMEYLPHGLGVAILAIAMSFVHPILIIPFGAAAVGVFTIATGIEIDYKNNCIRKYKSVFGYDWGKWKSLDKMVSAELKYYINNKTIGGSVTAVGVLPSSGPAKAFDLVFTNDLDEKDEFNSFTKYSFALKTMMALEKIPSLTVQNHIEAKLARQRQNRRR